MRNCLIVNEKHNRAGLEDLCLGESDHDWNPAEEDAAANVPQQEVCELGEEAQRSWFAMRDLTRRNAKLPAYKLLAQRDVEIFTPMKSVVRIKAEKRIREEIPFMQDLLFAHATRAQLDPIVDKVTTLQYRFVRGGKYCEPMVVPSADMERFILAVRGSEEPKYFQPSEITPSMIGRKVRIVGGPLNTFEGNLLSVRGSRKKRLMVSIPNLITAGVEVQPEFIRFI